MLHRLVFDSAAPAESANVGAFLRDANGDLLTSTLVGGDQALDVNLVQSVALVVSATDLDIRDLAFATDKVDVSGSSVTVAATDLDIRDLAFATDKVDVSGSSNVAVVDGGGSLTVDAVNLDIRDLAFATDKVDVSGSSITISATDLDIRDLVAATDSVTSWLADGAGTALTSTLVSGKQALDVNIANSIDVDDGLANAAIAAAASTVTTSSAALIASPLAARKYTIMYNNGNKPIFIGPSGVSASSGMPIYPGSILETRIGAAVAIHAVAASGSQNVRVMELA